MRPPPFRYHPRCMQHTARRHAASSRFRTTLTAMHAKVMSMHHVVAGQSHRVLYYPRHMDSWRHAHASVSACVHSHTHAITCMMHAEIQYPQCRILADTSMPCFMQNSVCRASGCAAHAISHYMAGCLLAPPSMLCDSPNAWTAMV